MTSGDRMHTGADARAVYAAWRLSTEVNARINGRDLACPYCRLSSEIESASDAGDWSEALSRALERLTRHTTWPELHEYHGGPHAGDLTEEEAAAATELIACYRNPHSQPTRPDVAEVLRSERRKPLLRLLPTRTV